MQLIGDKVCRKSRLFINMMLFNNSNLHSRGKRLRQYDRTQQYASLELSLSCIGRMSGEIWITQWVSAHGYVRGGLL